jgi:hypothetical protein
LSATKHIYEHGRSSRKTRTESSASSAAMIQERNLTNVLGACVTQARFDGEITARRSSRPIFKMLCTAVGIAENALP